MVASILTVASTKGGAGKTTIIMAIAGTLAAEGLRVAVVDADPNRAYASWAGEAYEGPEIDVRAEADEARLADAIDEMAPTADIVLIPCTPSRSDIEQAAKTLQLIEGAARAARRAIPARVVPSRIKVTTAVSKHAVAELDAAKLLRTTSTVSDRVAFAEMTFSGRVPPVATEAGQEVANLIAELRSLGWLPEKRALAPASH